MELFESMGMGTLDSYVADLEEALLSNTKDHYARKSQEWIETDSTPDYMIKVCVRVVGKQKEAFVENLTLILTFGA